MALRCFPATPDLCRRPSAGESDISSLAERKRKPRNSRGKSPTCTSTAGRTRPTSRPSPGPKRSIVGCCVRVRSRRREWSLSPISLWRTWLAKRTSTRMRCTPSGWLCRPKQIRTCGQTRLLTKLYRGKHLDPETATRDDWKTLVVSLRETAEIEYMID